MSDRNSGSQGGIDSVGQLVTVITPRSWLALFAVFAVLVSFVAWGFNGRVALETQAQCILLRSTGVTHVVSSVSGQITDLRVVVGDEVRQGDAVARVARPELVTEITNRLNQLEQLRSEGVSAGQAELISEINRLRNRLDSESRIISPYSGRVLSVVASQFEVVDPGAPIVSLELTGSEVKELEAVVYVPVDMAQMVAPGMPIRVSPRSAAKEKYGYILGTVVSVSPLPVSLERIAQAVGGQGIALQLTGGKESVEVRADLRTDPLSVSGLEWTSKEGPPFVITPGTLCESFITYDERRPFDMLLR